MQRYKQQGSALIVSLLILLVMTMLGIASMSTATMEEKMAANDRNQKIAFLNSELSLSTAEEDVIDANWADIQANIDANTVGYYAITDVQPGYFDRAAINPPNTGCIEQNIDGINSCYIIEHIYDPPSLSLEAYTGFSQSNTSYKIVKVTVFATDSSGLSSAKTQSHFKKTYLP